MHWKCQLTLHLWLTVNWVTIPFNSDLIGGHSQSVFWALDSRRPAMTANDNFSLSPPRPSSKVSEFDSSLIRLKWVATFDWFARWRCNSVANSTVAPSIFSKSQILDRFHTDFSPFFFQILGFLKNLEILKRFSQIFRKFVFQYSGFYFLN